MPAFGGMDSLDNLDTSYGSSDSSNGSALDSILSSVAQLGSAAIVTYGPKNSGVATNQGTLQPGLAQYAPSKSSMSLIVVALLVLAGVFIYQKL